MRVDAENILYLPIRIFLLLGAPLFWQLLERSGRAAISPDAANFHRRAKSHPFALEWYEFLNVIDHIAKTHELVHNHALIQICELYDSLDCMKNDALFENFKLKLKGKEQYYSTKFEAFTFSQYDSMGYQTSLIDENEHAGVKVPDIRVENSSGKRVFIECKSLLDDSREIEPTWDEAEFRIAKKLAPNRSLEHVILNVHERVTASEIKEFVDGLLGKIEIGRDITYDTEKISASYESKEITLVSDFDGGIPAIASGDRCKISMTYDKRTNKALEGYIIGTYLHKNIDVSERIIENLRSAKKKYVKGYPYLAHIQIPYSDSAQFLMSIDKSIGEICRYLSRNVEITAVIVVGRFIRSPGTYRNEPRDTHVRIIPNFDARYPLHEGFRAPGSQDISRYLKQADYKHASVAENLVVGAEGTGYVEYQLNEELSSQKGKYLLRHVNGDGTEQVIIWQSYLNIVRIEVVSKNIGFKKADYDLNYLASGVDHKIVFSWSGRGIVLYVNGQEVNTCQ